MKTLPYYDYTCSYDLDHEITKDVETLKKQVKNLQAKGKKKIIKALIETLLNEL